MVSEIRQIRIALANLEVQLEDFIALARLMNTQNAQLEKEIADLKNKLKENDNK